MSSRHPRNARKWLNSEKNVDLWLIVECTKDFQKGVWFFDLIRICQVLLLGLELENWHSPHNRKQTRALSLIGLYVITMVLSTEKLTTQRIFLDF